MRAQRTQAHSQTLIAFTPAAETASFAVNFPVINTVCVSEHSEALRRVRVHQCTHIQILCKVLTALLLLGKLNPRFYNSGEALQCVVLSYMLG